MRAIIIVMLLMVGCAQQEMDSPEVQNMPLTISSPAFEHETAIPERFTCKGDDINPELIFSELPVETKSLVLIMDDPDAPVGNWDHWILYNMQPIDGIGEDSVPEGAVQGLNSWGNLDYGGPCPPSGTHRYLFKLYALDIILDLPEGATKNAIEEAMQGNILEEAVLIGLFSH